jgi:phage baseplate assembly protein W
MATMYRGFSTYNRLKKFRLTDADLVKQDLFNHFNIKKGEKLMNPNFGTIIWGMLFENLTTEAKKAITDDIKTIVNYDPRVSVQNVIVNQFEHGIQVELELKYALTNKIESMKMTFDRGATSLKISA